MLKGLRPEESSKFHVGISAQSFNSRSSRRKRSSRTVLAMRKKATPALAPQSAWAGAGNRRRPKRPRQRPDSAEVSRKFQMCRPQSSPHSTQSLGRCEDHGSPQCQLALCQAAHQDNVKKEPCLEIVPRYFWHAHLHCAFLAKGWEACCCRAHAKTKP